MRRLPDAIVLPSYPVMAALLTAAAVATGDWSDLLRAALGGLALGGFYFALLSGETSHKVPKISNGTFHPVIEFGVGLSIGVGKNIDEGVFKAGLSVTVVGIVEGLNPKLIRRTTRLRRQLHLPRQTLRRPLPPPRRRKETTQRNRPRTRPNRTLPDRTRTSAVSVREARPAGA